MPPTAPPEFLAPCDVIDSGDPAVQCVAQRLRRENRHDFVDACFRFVRDEIQHSNDFQRNPVTCAASQVLQHRTGYCYAKSHLLCALLRAGGVPAGLCYQRLSVDETGPPYCLHGLNAVWLPESGWFRVDARGNKPGVDAQFEPPVERLAFVPSLPGERNLPGVFARPLPVVVTALKGYENWDSLLASLPDGDWDDATIPRH